MSKLANVFNYPEFSKFEFTALGCRVGSAWHDWSKIGALYARRMPEGTNFGAAAEKFAKGHPDDAHPKGSNIYRARKRAFLVGVSNTALLTPVAKE